MPSINDIRRALPELVKDPDSVYSSEEKEELEDLQRRLEILEADMQRSEHAAYQLADGQTVLRTRIRNLTNLGHERRKALLAEAFGNASSDELESALRDLYVGNFRGEPTEPRKSRR